MPTIVTRSGKGSPLTNTELDANFTNLNTYVDASARPAIRPSLLLDFANSKTLDPRITFTRASSATRTNSQGLIESVPAGVPRFDHDPITLACKGLFIEEQRTNLLTYSEQFDKAAWGKTNATVIPNAAIAPDGTWSACKVSNTPSIYSYLYYDDHIANSTTYTKTIYVKLAPDNTKPNFVLVHGLGSSGETAVDFNLTTLAISGSLAANSSITSVGAGWYRLSSKFTTDATGLPGNGVYYLGSYGSTPLNASFYIWGAQLEAGSFPTSYIPSTDTFTSRASTATFIGSNGLIQTAAANVARYQYNPNNLSIAPKLLIEGGSTNFLTYSEDPTHSSWGKNSISVTAEASVIALGKPAWKLTETAVGGVQHTLWKTVFSATAGQSYVAWRVVKPSERTVVSISFGWIGPDYYRGACFNLSSGICQLTDAIGTAYKAVACGMLPVGNGAYLCWVSDVAPSGAASLNVELKLRTAYGADTDERYTGDGTSGIYDFFGQVEQGSYPTSYIPTTSAQVTRAADVSSSAQTTRAADVATMTGSNFSSWFNQSEGSLFVEADHIPSASSYFISVYISDGIAGNCIQLASGPNTHFNVLAGYTAKANIDLGDNVQGVFSKISVAYKANDFAGSMNAGSIGADTSGELPVVNQMRIGGHSYGMYATGHISRLAYYPKRVTNTELQALTA